MLERHYNIGRHAHMVKQKIHKQCKKQVMKGSNSLTVKKGEDFRSHTSISDVTSEFIYSKSHWETMCSSPVHISG